MRYFFHVSDETGTIKDEAGTVLSSQDVALLRAAVLTAELARDGEYRRGYLVWVVDEQGNEIARCQSTPRLAISDQPEPSDGGGRRQFDEPPVPYAHRRYDPANLTAREREVLTWISLGKSAWEIGEILGIAKRTVDEHAQTAARKLRATNRTQAVAIAVRDSLIDF